MACHPSPESSVWKSAPEIFSYSHNLSLLHKSDAQTAPTFIPTSKLNTLAGQSFAHKFA